MMLPIGTQAKHRNIMRLTVSLAMILTLVGLVDNTQGMEGQQPPVRFSFKNQTPKFNLNRINQDSTEEKESQQQPSTAPHTTPPAAGTSHTVGVQDVYVKMSLPDTVEVFTDKQSIHPTAWEKSARGITMGQGITAYFKKGQGQTSGDPHWSINSQPVKRNGGRVYMVFHDSRTHSPQGWAARWGADSSSPSNPELTLWKVNTRTESLPAIMVRGGGTAEKLYEAIDDVIGETHSVKNPHETEPEVAAFAEALLKNVH